MSSDTETNVPFEILTKYGAKWAVLAAMQMDLIPRGIHLPPTVKKDLDMIRVKIASGCFSSCEIGCELGKIEGQFIGLAASQGDEYIAKWFDLLAMAFAGEITSENIAQIPLLKPIESKCGFLKCTC